MTGGIIEGFYGAPWSHEERLDMLDFCARRGLNAYVYAPKDDAYHRARWREPYPEEELARLAELATAARARGIDFAWAVAPGLSIRYSSEDDFAALVAKTHQLRDAGIRAFRLLWDDVPDELRHHEDRERFGGEASPLAAAQVHLTNRFARDLDAPLATVPVEYAGTSRSPYRDTFAAQLDADILVYWTGPAVVSQAIEREELDAAADALGHELLLWDNYPANDFDPARLFLAPLTGRDPRLADGRLAGLHANPMVQCVPSKLALATVADFVRDPAAYDEMQSFERALREFGEEVVAALRGLAPVAAHEQLEPHEAIARLRPGVDAATALAVLEPLV